MQHSRFHALLTAVVILGLILALAPVPLAHAAEICGKFDTLSVMGGQYIVQNNVWGASTAQCVNVPSTGSTAFTVTTSAHNQGSVASYPSVFKGCHWGQCTSNSGMPIRVNQLSSAPFTWNITRASSGAWNVAAEAWFSAITDTSQGYNGGAELMIWLSYQNMQPAGSQVGTVNIGGVTWEVWFANIGWNYIAYRRNGATSANLNLKDFIDDSVARGYIQPAWYLHVFEAGTELMSGGAGFSSNAFSFSVNGGGGPTSTPTRTPIGPTATRTRTPVGPTATRTRTPVGPTATRTPVSGGGCTVTYTVNDWNNGQGGFTGNVTIRNNGSTAINGWTLTWTFANQRVDQGWEATITQPGGAGTAVSAANVSHNASIGPNGGSRAFGFNGTYFGSNPRPASFALNGAACTVQ